MRTAMARVLLGTFIASTVMMPMSALANEKGKKNTTIGTGAAAAVLLLTRHTTLGTLTGAAAVYSYSQYEREHERNLRARAYRQGYRHGQRDTHQASRR